MSFDDLLYDKQAQSKSADASRRRGALEPLEDQRAFVLRNARPAVADRQCRELVIRVDSDQDRAAGSVFRGVRKQVHRQLLDPRAVPEAVHAGLEARLDKAFRSGELLGVLL